MLGLDTYHNTKHVLALAPVVVSATGVSLTVDRVDYQSVMFDILTGVITAADATNFLTISMEESDTVDTATPPAITGGTVVAAVDIIGTFPLLNNTTTKASALTKVGYRGVKRYVRLVFTETLTFSGIVGAVAVLGRPRDFPVA